MAPLAVHVVHEHVGATGHGNAVILVDDSGVDDGDAVADRHAETVTVVGSGLTIGQIIGLEAGTVVQVQSVDDDVAAACDLDVVHRPVDDVQLGYSRVVHL